MNSFLHKLRALFARRRKEDELREEIEFHLAEEAEERGHDADEARTAARRDFGNLAFVQEETRATWTWIWLEQLAQDLRYGWRTMGANKAFSLLAIVSLALGIGANTAIYSFMDWLLLRSLPVADPQSLAVFHWRAAERSRDSVVRSMSGSIWKDERSGGPRSGIFPYPAFELIRDNSGEVFSSVFAHYPTRKVNAIVKGQAELASGVYVSGDYFRGLGVTPAAGRSIVPDDDREGAPSVVVLSFAYCQRRFGDAARALGQSILINNAPFTVAGVAPPEFFGVDPQAAPDFYVPVRASSQIKSRGGGSDAKDYLNANYYWIEVMGRLKPGASRTQAQAALSPMFHRWVASTAANDRERAKLPELLVEEGAAGLDTLRRRYSKPLYVLLAMTGLILAIACANIANLLLARAAARRREIAVRLGIGAGRFRVIRQLLTESVLLSSIGGALGVLFAVWGIRFLTLLLANGSEDFTMRPTVNWSVLGAALALSLLTGLVFGLAPALQSTRVDVFPALKEARAGQPSSRRTVGLGPALVAAQIGLSVVMLAGAGLFVRTLGNLQSVELGFNRENVLLFQTNARQAGHRDPEIATFYRELRNRFAAIPGVRGATASQSPLLGQGTWSSRVVPAGMEAKGSTNVLATGRDFFSTMQIPVILGRAFDERDRPGSAPVAVVNEAYATKYFGERNPIGERLTIHLNEFPKREIEIVGVAKNSRYGAIKGEFREILYLPFDQGSYYPPEEMTFALRTGGDPLGYVHAVREIVRQADARVPVTDVRTQEAQVDRMMNQEILFARLCTGFATLALAIACVGLYGTMSYTVARRTGEIGIRMALGAKRGTVIWMIVRQVLILATVGLAVGVPMALGASKWVESFLYGVPPNDAAALLGAVAILVLAALFAGYFPARRASRIDPMVAIRHE